MPEDAANHFDLLLLGAGSGNTILDDRFEDWKVAVVERDRFGGTCLNVGCVPTKMLVVAPADVATSVHDSARLGVDATLDAVRWTDIRDRVFGRIDPIVADGARYRRSQPHVTVLGGDARFTGSRRLVVDLPDGPEEVTADRVVVAAGARPTIPDVPGLTDLPFHTSDTVMRIDELPRRMVVLGGGFIAAEMAHIFGAYGVEVIIVTHGRGLITHHDADVSHALTQVYAERFELHVGVAATAARRAVDDGIVLELSDGGSVEGDLLLVATGRTPNADQLDVAAAGIEVHADGRIRTDSTMATSAAGVMALGDITSPHMLKHVANHEARVVQHNLLYPDDPIRIDERVVPHVVFGDPQVAAVGLSEAEAREAAGARGGRIGVGLRRIADTAAGWALEDTTGFCKVVADLDTRRVLGAHIIGPWASVLIQPLVTGMAFGLTIDELARGQLYPHPALTEVVEQALLEL